MADLIIKWLIPFICGGVATFVATLTNKNKALKSGLQCLLRAEIIRSYDKYTARKFIPIYAKESLEKAYKAYHKLGGNDVATELYSKLMILPTEKKEDIYVQNCT